MLGARTSLVKDQTLVGLGLTVVGLSLAWAMGNWITGGNFDELIYVFLAAIVIVIGGVIFQDWRSGFYLFLFWVIFEDLIRKYMGNNMAIYFGKDALVVLIYVSLTLCDAPGDLFLVRSDAGVQPLFLERFVRRAWTQGGFSLRRTDVRGLRTDSN